MARCSGDKLPIERVIHKDLIVASHGNHCSAISAAKTYMHVITEMVARTGEDKGTKPRMSVPGKNFLTGLDQVCVSEEPFRRVGYLQSGVARSNFQNAGRVFACKVISPVNLNHSFSKSPGPIGAQRVHAAEVFDGIQATKENPAISHHGRGTCQIDAENRRQELRAQAYRQRNRKKQRFDRRPASELYWRSRIVASSDESPSCVECRRLRSSEMSIDQ